MLIEVGHFFRRYKVVRISQCITIILIIVFIFTKIHTKKPRLRIPYSFHPVDAHAEMVQDYPNLPVEYLRKMYSNNENDVSSPSYSRNTFQIFKKINLINKYWQGLKFETLNIQFYSAYLDTRRINARPTIRVLSMIDKYVSSWDFTCLIWFQDHRPLYDNGTQLYYMWSEYWASHVDGEFGAYLLSCVVPDTAKNSIPVAVSIISNRQENITNILRVVHSDHRKKQEIAVCVKGLMFDSQDFSLRLVEWIEMVRLFGVDKIFFYNLHAPANMEKVLTYYRTKGFVDVRKTTLPEGLPNIPPLQRMFLDRNLAQKRMIEVLQYNDCFYRNIQVYKFVVLLDIDEMIVPLMDKSWSDMIKRVRSTANKSNLIASYAVRHVYFLDDMYSRQTISFRHVPPYMHMMQHVFRANTFAYQSHFAKTFFDTELVIVLHNHRPLLVVPNVQIQLLLEKNVAQLHHYRETCNVGVECEDYKNHPVFDDTLWRFKKSLVYAVTDALNELEFLETTG